MGVPSAEALVGKIPARILRWISRGLRFTSVFCVFLVIWVLGMQQRAGKESIIKPIQYIGHSDEAGYAFAGLNIAEGRGYVVPYVSYFFRPYQPWGSGGDGGAGVYRREDHWPPFMGFAIAPCVYFLGKDPWIFKLPAIFFGSVGMPLTTALLAYALSRRGYVAIIAGLIMMANPLIYTESLKTLSDISTGMLIAGFAGSVVLAQRHPWMHIIAGAFLAGAYFAKGSQLVLLGVYPVMALLCTGPGVFFRKSFWAGIGTAVFLMAPFWYGNWKAYGYAFFSTQNYVSGWYSVDNNWELRAYYPYWNENLPKTSDLWTPVTPPADGKPLPDAVRPRVTYAQTYWHTVVSRRLSYSADALTGGRGAAAGGATGDPWSDFGPLGLWWREVINRLPRGPTTGPNAFTVAEGNKPFELPPIRPLFSWSTFNMPLITSKVNVPCVTDAFRAWAAKAGGPTTPNSAAPAPRPVAVSPRSAADVSLAPPPMTAQPPRPSTVRLWPFGELAGLGVITSLSLALMGLPLAVLAGAIRYAWRWWQWRKNRATAFRTPRPPLQPVWFPGPVIAVALLLAMEIGFIAYLWAVWESRFCIPFYPLAMGLGCAAWSFIFETPILLAAALLRGLIALAVVKWKRGPTVRAWVAGTFAALGHAPAVLTIIVALTLLTRHAQVFARINEQAATRSGGYPYSDELEYPTVGKWIGKNLPNAVVMCRNPWELLFYCGANNRGVASVNPGDSSPAGAEKILAIANYYHVTHIFADEIRPAMASYISAHPRAFKRVPGAPGSIFEIVWSEIKVKTPEQALALRAGDPEQ